MLLWSGDLVHKRTARKRDSGGGGDLAVPSPTIEVVKAATARGETKLLEHHHVADRTRESCV